MASYRDYSQGDASSSSSSEAAEKKTCYRAKEYKSSRSPSNMHMIIFVSEKESHRITEYRNSYEVELALVLICYDTNGLPHLPYVTFLQSSHWLETRRNWQTVKNKKKKWTRTIANLPFSIGCAVGTRGFWEARFMSVVWLKNDMTNDGACKCVGIRLTSKSCHQLGSIATEPAPQSQLFRHQPTRMEHTVIPWRCYH